MKSKVMVFRKGGMLSKGDTWVYNGNNIEVINKYKYLGVTLAKKLS